MPVQAFISYARADDEVPPGADAKGFVTFLDEQLRYELGQLGGGRVRLWRDTRRVERAHHFEPRIEEAVAASALFIAVLSNNWLDRPWCRRELESFRQRWKGDEIKERIIVIAKHPIPEEQIPPLLRGQEGYRFFARGPDEDDDWQEFFSRGGVCDPRYYARIRELARYLWNAAGRLDSPGPPPTTPKPAAAPPAIDKGRTIYLAKPAPDMRLAYDRLVRELSGAGYGVTPPPEEEIPYDGERAEAFVDRALAAAELSVHPLGDRSGYAPDGAPPIVQLQLARAAMRVAAGGFRRILWTPRFVAEDGENAAERDPSAVVERLDKQLDSDKIVGDSLSRFAGYLIEHLDSTAPAAQMLETIEAGAEVYIYHRPEDEDYAVDLALALQQHKLKPVFPAFEGNPEELEEFHRTALRECAGIVLCWAKASEVWIRATCRNWRSWERLGRTAKFAVRGLVAGPPPGSRKSVLVKIPPKDEVDVVLDLTAFDRPPPEALDPLIRAGALDAPHTG